MAQVTPHQTIADLGTNMGHAIGRHLETAFRALAQGPHAVHTPGYFRLTTGEQHPFGNIAILSDSRDLESARAAVAPLAAAAFPSAVLLPDLDTNGDLDALLGAAGFVAQEAMPAMGVENAALPVTTLPAGYTFDRVLGAPASEEWTRQLAAGYGLPFGVARYFSPMATPADPAPDAPLQYFAVRKHGAIVSTSTLYLMDGLAGIYCVSTVEEERGKGLGAHITAEPLRLAARMGYGVGILQASESGYSTYKRLGFRDFGHVPLYVRLVTR
jgi:NAD(P)-dependent dehydrogenase (short-subunit alcohol dehydrogenase family)